MEFDEATDAGCYRIVFLLDEDTPLPGSSSTATPPGSTVSGIGFAAGPVWS
jgi:hypothetical protein